ncbi:translation initiation factor IF-2 [Neurospora sp. IMI 360204]|nr:translation initiation factor IF-2 [Neurospora sp. IMI 360204]
MMRGGLLQKQSTSSVCLLCRHRWQLRQQQQQRIHPNTRRVYSSWDDKPSWGTQQQPATPSAGGEGGGGGGGWGGSWKPAAPATPGTQTTPGTGTEQSQPKPTDYGLLPHEKVARERLLRMAAAAVAPKPAPQPARKLAPEPFKRPPSDRPVRRLPEGQQNEFKGAPPRKEQQAPVVRKMPMRPKEPGQGPTTETPGPKTEREAQKNQAPVRKVLEPFGIRRFPAQAPAPQQAPRESASSQTAPSEPIPSRPTQDPTGQSQPTVSSLSSLSSVEPSKPGPTSQPSEQVDGASGQSSWDAFTAASLTPPAKPTEPAGAGWGTSSWGTSSWGASSTSSQPASQSQTERLLPHEKVVRDRLQQRHAQNQPQAPAKNLRSLADGLFAHDRQTSAKDLWKRQETGSLKDDLQNAEEEERRADNTDAWDDIFSTQPPPPPPPRTSAREVYQSISSKFAPPPDSNSTRETERQWTGLTRRYTVGNVENVHLTDNNDFVKTAPASQGERRSEPRDNSNFWKQAEDRYATRPASQAQSEAASEGTREATEAFKKQMSDDWDWADDYGGKPKEKEGQKLEHQDFEKPRGRDNARQTRGDRVALEEIPIPSRYIKEEKKPKKKGGRRRDYNEDDDFDDMAYEYKRRERLAKKAEKERLQYEETGPIPILLPEFISVANLGMALGVKTELFISQLGELGFEDIAKDSIMTGETAALVAQEYGFEPTVDGGEDEDLRPRPPPEDPSTVPLRPPVVTIMGHVDHGKTTLLDFLRKSSIAAGEHGGITQHIGAFSVQMSSGKQITFLDTPGHAAFLSMRQRGANVTDIVILVVAADDSVKPQTIEAIKHARSAKVPMIVAINKIDKDQANVERVKSDLAAHGVEIEDYGGDVQVVCVSGKTGQGMDDLEDNILLLSEMLDIRAESDGMAEGWVLESSIKPIGRVATVLVKRGTLRPGDFIVAGRVFAKVRSLRNEAGVEVEEAPPGTAVEILGWKEPPEAGDMVLQAPNEDKAKNAVHYRIEQKEREEAMEQITEMERLKREREAERLAAEEAEKGEDGAEATEEKPDGPKMINFTVKGDVHGSVEAVCASILEIGSNEVRPRVLLSSPGQITESDVEHAAVSGSTIINFNNPIPGHIKRMAVENKVKIMDHNIIYNLTEEVRQVLSESLPPTISYKVLGEAEVAQVFAINIKGRKYKNIAGVKVRNGMVMRNGRVRLQRKGEVVYDGTISSVKHGKKEVTEMRKGTECGLEFGGEFDDVKEGDLIQVVEEIREKRYL